MDDNNGSGVKHVTVYVAKDGGNFEIWQRQTTETSAIYQGETGHEYEFIALATDNAGNREQPRLGIQPPDDGSSVNLGTLPNFDRTSTPDLGKPPSPTPQPSTNPLFTEAEKLIPSVVPTSRQSEFESILQPFTTQSFVTGIRQSHGNIGPMAIAVKPDGSALVSGGSGRNEIYLIPPEGLAGNAGGNLGASLAPLQVLPYPIFDLAFDPQGNLWATTGGNGLLKLNAETGAIVKNYGESITQTLAIDAATGTIYVSSANGVEIFDPTKESFSHFSDIRVGNLAFDNQGNLWGATWPDRGDIIRFDQRGKAQKMLEFNTPVDSLSFGKVGTKLEGLLFISNNSGVKPNTDSQLIMVDVATLRQVSLAKGGSRGDIIKTTADGRILLSQSHQIDVISPLVAPRVAYTNPAPNANLTLPENTITVVFDQDMLVGTATDAASILNPANYQLSGQTVGNLTPLSVIYDPATRSALLNFEALIPDQYELRVENSLRSKAGLAIPEDYITKFTAISDFLPFVNFQFNTPRSDRANQTVSYDVTITSKGDSDLLLPLVLLLDPSRQFTGQPLGASGQNGEGAYLIDLSDSLPNGRLKPGQSITGKVINVKNPDNLRVDFTPGLYALPYPNLAPNFTSSPVINAIASQPYTYQVKAQDPDGVALAYLLYDGPDGMTLNATTGVINWTPTATSAVETPVTLRVYDSRGGYGTQSFKIKVEGGNHKPILQPLPTQIEGQEGESLQIGIAAIDEDNNPLIFWADNLPGGAVFDGTKGLLTWTPNYEAAGTYENVTFFASDGSEIVSQSTQIRIAPTNQAPTLIRPSDRIVREGDKVRMQLTANDPEAADLKYLSNLLPGGAKLDPKTGLFEWTPAYFQAGEFEVPFSVSDGEKTTKQTVKITVLNANAVPVFDEIGTWQIQEGQLLYIQPFAFDPDNPSFALPFRLPDGSLTPLEGGEASVTYTVSNLPHGATFDADTATLKWTPDFTSAGNYTITVTATDDGNGTGNNASASINIPIRVENTNRIPEITPIPNQTLQRGEVVEIPIQVTDPDGNPIVITAQGLPGFSIPSFATFTDNKDGTGLLRFAPSLADDSGDYTITLKVRDDGDGGKSGIQTQEYTFIVSVDAPNDSPKLSRISDQVAVVGTPLQFVIEASDKNQDNLNFSAIGLPTGATLTPSNIYGKAIFSWTPTASSLGSYPITIKVTDSGNGDSNNILSDQKALNLVVRNSNQSPVLAPITSQTIDEGKTLQLTVSATDSEGDPLTYTATNLPQGATLDPVTGSLTWTPKYVDAGTYKDIAITATDGNKSSSQPLTIQVNNVNQKPVLIPVPIQAGREKSAIQFFLSGNDADGDSLSYSAVTKLPDGAFFDTRTQQFRWTPGYEQAGEYKLRFAVFDPQGASDTIDVTLKVDNVNRSPSLKVSNHNAVLGKELKFNLIGSDPDLNTTLTYSIKDLPEGATFNPKTGEFSWLPNPGQVGDYPLTFGVSDGESSVTERVLIHAAIAPEPLPVTIELTPSFPAIPGQKVLIHAMATSLADIATINLSVNGQPLTLDSQGRGEFTPNTPGQYLVTAKATDVDGFAGQTTSIIKVRNPQDNLPPVVAFLNDLEGEKIANVTSIVGTVADLNLDEWSLELASLGSNDYVKLAGGNQALATAPLTQLDPTTLSNGFYQLKLKATDISGRTSFTTAIIEINTSQKSSQYQRSETDLTVTLEGVNLDLIRVYDSLNSSHSATFGHGWRLGNTDTQIQTNVPLSGRENLGVYNPFRVGTRLYLTLPNGERVGFTFQPQRQEIPGLVYYTPAWVADTGVNYTLQSQDALLSLAGERLYELKTGQPYNPTTVGAQALHPVPSFTLTAPDGTIYHLDATGKVQAQIAANRVKLTYSDSGIISPSGELVSFIQDAEGRLSQISAPDGRIITYKYDAQGNLINARNLALAQSNYYSYAADHRLTLVAAANQPGATISYNTPQPQVATLTGNLGSAFQFNPTVTQGEFKTGEIQRYSFSVRQSEVNSTATGIVLLGVEVKGNNIEPNLPVIQRLTPLSSQLNSNSAFSLFAVDQEGLNLLEVQGKTGNYSLQMFVAGDVNQDGLVDGVDGQLLTAGLGRKVGEVGYSLNLDVNRDGTINATDVQILGSNFGFKANQAPVVKTTSLLTHEDLQVTVPLINLAEDLEGDEVFYRVLNPVNGTVGMTPNGKGAIFTPNADYTGTASFELIADDGFSSSQPVKVTVNVSDAALINLDIQNRNPILEKGERTQLVFIGDFADQKDVILPSNYLTLVSSNPTAATINPNGQVLGLAAGNGVISVSRNGIQAVTAFNVGIPTEAIEQAILVLGLGKYPETLALATQVGTRQLKVDLAGQIDLTKAEQGTSYYVGNSNVVSVSADGLVTAKNAGLTTITVINGGSEALIPVQVTNPVSGPVVIGNKGGVVQGTDGSLISIGPGTIPEGITVNINAIGVDSLPYLVPEPFQALKAFELNLGNKTLNQPIQLAIPVDSSVAAGAEVYFFRASTVPDENGNEQPVWLQLEKGIVGSDGYARTSSPPFTGIWGSGTYFMGYAPPDSLGVVNITLEGNTGNSVVIFNDAPALRATTAFAPVSFEVQPTSLSGVLAQIAVMAINATLATPISRGYKQIEVRSIPQVGLPIKTSYGLEVKPGINMLTIPDITPPASDNALIDPVLLGVKLEITDTGTEIVLKGERFKGEHFTPNGTATPKVYFHNPNGDQVEGVVETATNTEIKVTVPRSIVVGLSEVSVVRPDYQQITTRLGFEKIPTEYQSNRLSFEDYLKGDHAITTDGVRVSFIDTKQGDLVARIFLEDKNYPRNAGSQNYLAVTSDLTRAYLSITSTEEISVIDTQAFQEIDVNPQTEKIEGISLGSGSRAGTMVIDAQSKYLYVADLAQPLIYAVDINPQSKTYHKLIETIPVEAPYGIQRLALNSDGTRLYGTAPGENIFLVGRQREVGKIVVVHLDSSKKEETLVKQVEYIQADRQPYAIIATPDPNKMLFTNASNDKSGFGIIEGTNVRYVNLTLGEERDYFDVNNATGIAFLPKKTLGDWQTEDYAFVSAYNSPFPLGDPSHYPNDDPFFGFDPYFNPFRPPNGGNVGIILDPLGTNSQLIAATRPINWGLPRNLVLSPDGKSLFVPYMGAASSVFAYDVSEILKTIKSKSPEELAEIPIDGFYSYRNYSRNFRGAASPQDRENDKRIDWRADYTLLDSNNQPFIFTYSRIQPKIGVPEGSNNAPIGTGWVANIAVQQNDWLKLDAPLFTSTSDPTPEFTWEYSNGVRPEDVKEVKLYVSVFPKGEGLLPDDRPAGIAPAILDRYSDINPNRILTATWDKAANSWTWSDDSLNTTDNDSFILPDNRTLTAGQTYYWAVEATRNTGHKVTKTGEFKTAPIELNTPFNGVTIITHGFQPGFSSRDDGRGGIPPGDITWAYQMAEEIVRSAGGGEVRKYNPQTGLWDLRTTIPKTDPEVKGNSLVLISDWYKESDIDDSGFSEAAADAIFASLVQLNDQEGNKIFNSPLHLIGHSRGTIVTSEIIQRLGTYRPDIKNIHLTTLDVHDFRQDNLNVLGFKWADFQEPDVTVWENVDFADNYYQDLAENNLAGLSSSTPNGRSLLNTNLDLYLNGKVGFQKDDALGQFNGIAIRTALAALRGAVRRGLPGAVISGLIQAVKEAVNAETRSPVVGPHSRVWRWYAGTTNLSLTGFDFAVDNQGNRRVNESKEPLFRKLGNEREFRLLGGDRLYDNNGVPHPWYIPREFEDIPSATPWEGIGVGWYYSVLGGGTDARPNNTVVGLPVDRDNTHPNEKGVTPDQVVKENSAIPSIFNGHFEAGTIRRGERLWFASEEIPGWSFHGGYSGIGIQQERTIRPDFGVVGIYDTSEGTARIGKERNGNHYLIMDDTFSNNVITHNRFYIPYTDQVQGLKFKYQVKDASPNDQLKVFLTVDKKYELGTINVNQITNNFVSAFFALPNGGLRGKIGTITFELTDSQNNKNVDSTIWLDDVTLGRNLCDITLENVALASSVIKENDLAKVTASVNLDDDCNSAKLLVNWGDGTPQQTIVVNKISPNNNTIPVQLEHRYLDDEPNGTLEDIYPIKVQLLNSASPTVTLNQTVKNIEPKILAVSLDQQTIESGQKVTLNGTFLDIGTKDNVVMFIDWGDGDVSGRSFLAANRPETGVFDILDQNGQPYTHIYADDNPTGTPQDTYTVKVTLEDDDGGEHFLTRTITVKNAIPQLESMANVLVDERTELVLDNFASFTDNDFGNTETWRYTINWGDGTQNFSQPVTNIIEGGEGFPSQGFISDRHTYKQEGIYTVTVTVFDDDGGQAQQTFNVIVNNIDPIQPLQKLALMRQSIEQETTVNPYLQARSLSDNLPSQFIIANTSSPGILNPNFSISNPNDTQFGWTTQGAATVSNGIATLSENSPNNARFSQTFLIPNNATTLQFTILNANLGATSLTPPDAFEVALLNANTLTPLVGTSSGLNNTDAFLNLQKNGQIYLSPQVSLNSPNLSNSPITVSVDLTGIAAGTAATLYFDLLGFGQREASVSIDNVLLLTDNPNLPPTSVNDSITTPEDTSITIPVLNNDTDDGTLDPTSLAIISNPSQGQIQLNPDGTITYTPKPNFNGTDTFSYTVKDDIGQTSNSATVTVTVTPVNDLPTLTNDSITLNQGSSVTFSVLSNDTDIDGTIDATTLAIATNPTHGQLQLNPDATFTYTPNPNFSGTDTFTYTVKDNGGQISQPATVTLTVNNLPPTITNLIGDTQIKEGDQAGFQAIATDPGNDTLSYSWNFGDGSNPVTGQSVNHKFADNGSYVVTLTVTDTFGASTSQNLNVNVANVAPTVNARSDRTATQGTAVTLAGNFTDPGILDTHSLTWDFGDGTTASNTLTPTHIYTTPGDYTVTLTVTDKDGAIISDTLNLSVTPTTELPTVAINDVTIKEKDGITSARFTVTLSQASNQAITVNFNTSDGTAKAGIDYLSRQGQISFAAGETSKTLEITLKTRKRGDIDGDGDIDRDDLNLIVAGRNTSARIPQPNQKTFFLNLGDITGATLLDNQGTGILLSDGLDPRDLDGDGLITVLDARILAVLMRS